MKRPALLFGFCLLAGPTAALACPGLEVEASWIREPPPGAPVLAGFGEFRNTGSATLTIDRVESAAFAHLMLHETQIENGQARMLPRESLVIPPGESLTLAPGGLHLMLHQPVTPPAAGQTVEIVMHCGAARLPVNFEIRPEAP